MKRGAWLLIMLLSGCGYSHVAETRTTFERAGSGLTLTVYRHLDTVISGPDFEEEQRLVLTLRDIEVGKRIPVPSPQVSVQFDVARFGPSSEGKEFTGTVLVKSVAANKIVVNLDLTVTARTRNGSYTQRAKFRGDHTFYPITARTD